jgi:hypothetical protein
MTATVTITRDDTSGHPAIPPVASVRPGPAKLSNRAVVTGLASLAINFLVPLLAYHLVRPHTGSSAMALALAGSIPVAYTLAILAVRRRLSALGVVSVASFAVGVLGSWVCGGSTLAMELQDPALTGLVGIACLVSIALGHPLHQVILRWLGRGNPSASHDSASHDSASHAADRAATRASMVSTAIIGLAFLGHAVAIAVLALTQTTGTFLILQQPVGLPFFGLGVAGLFIYGSRRQTRQHATTTAAAAQPSHDRVAGTS